MVLSSAKWFKHLDEEEKPKDLTVSQIEDLLGYKIKIVP